MEAMNFIKSGPPLLYEDSGDVVRPALNVRFHRARGGVKQARAKQKQEKRTEKKMKIFS
jgi:hypothetical protein